MCGIIKINTKYKLLALATIAILIATVNNLYAIPEFFPDEMVVTPRFAASSLSQSSISPDIDNKKYSIQSLGNSLLLKSKTQASMLFSESPKDPCEEFLKVHPDYDCSPNYVMRTNAVPNDPGFSQTWGLGKAVQGAANAQDAWDLETGSSDIVVAVIDTGIDYDHPDLAANMWVNPGEIAGNNADDDGNGVIDDIYGYNAFSNNGNPDDGNGHGTHCAGTIGGRGNNSVGVPGVNWNVKLMALKFLGDNGSGSLAGAIQAINYMVMMKNRGVNIRVSNNSWGGGGYSQALANAIQAAKNAGILFVAAAGNSANDNDSNPSYPANYDVDNVVSVAAIDSSGNLASFSNYGANTVDIGAPGVSVYSTYKNGSYASLSGTSMATPHVSGALALLYADEPTLTMSQAIARMRDSGVDMATLTGIVQSGRKLEIHRMIANITSPIQPPPQDPEPCSYSAEEIAYSPDTSADSADIIQQSDELNYKQVNLPFSFPFHRKDIGSVYISPNGVLYTKNAPSGMDYENTNSAPLNSIAALHTDLTADTNPFGVRYAGNSEKAVFSYNSKVYGQSNGDVRVRAVLKSSGVIEVFYEASNSTLVSLIGNNATIGLTGHTSTSRVTYAYNNPNKIHNNLGVRFTPQCDNNESGLTISSLRARGINGSRLTKFMNVRTGLFNISGSGAGSGLVNLAVRVNGSNCRLGTELPFSEGLASMNYDIGRLARLAYALNFKLDDGTKVHSTTVKVSPLRRARIKNRLSAKAKSRNISRICSAIANQ
jgi:hypothetical protein